MGESEADYWKREAVQALLVGRHTGEPEREAALEALAESNVGG